MNSRQMVLDGHEVVVGVMVDDLLDSRGLTNLDRTLRWLTAIVAVAVGAVIAGAVAGLPLLAAGGGGALAFAVVVGLLAWFERRQNSPSCQSELLRWGAIRRIGTLPRTGTVH